MLKAPPKAKNLFASFRAITHDLPGQAFQVRTLWQTSDTKLAVKFLISDNWKCTVWVAKGVGQSKIFAIHTVG